MNEKAGALTHIFNDVFRESVQEAVEPLRDQIDSIRGGMGTRFSQTKEAIVYDAVQTGDGWRVEVVFPPDIPPSDHILVLNWLEGYRTSIRQQYPLWLTALHTKSSRLWLDIKPVSGIRELVEKGPDMNMKGSFDT